MPRLTKDERDAIRRDQHRQMSEWHSHDITQVLRLLDSHDAAEDEVARLRKALHLICEIHSARFEHPTFTLLGVLDDIRKAACDALGSDVPTADL